MLQLYIFISKLWVKIWNCDWLTDQSIDIQRPEVQEMLPHLKTMCECWVSIIFVHFGLCRQDLSSLIDLQGWIRSSTDYWSLQFVLLPINLEPNEANYRSEAFMGWRIYVWGGWANSYTIRGRTRMDPLTIRYGSQSEQQTERRRRRRRKRFAIMNAWKEIVRFFEQTNFLAPLDLCSSVSGSAIYSLFG